MADPTYGTLTPSDLIGFQNQVTQSDPYGIIGKSLQSWQPDTTTWSPVESGVTSFAKAFASGLLQNYAQQRAADQTNSVISLLPQLGSDPMSVVAPEGVSAAPFATLQGTAVLNNYIMRQQAEAVKNSDIAKLYNMVIGKGIENKTIDLPSAIQAIDTGDYSKITAPRPLQQGTLSPPVDSPLATGRESTLQKTQKYFQQFVAAGMPEVQAATAAKDQVKGEIAANNKSFDDAKAAREYGQNLLSMANTTRAGMSKAGQTGPFNTLASAYENIASALGSSEATQQLQGDALIKSVAPDVIKMARPIGGGATSDFEAKTYLGSGVNTGLIPEVNAAMVAKMENLGKLNIDYADFLEAYKDANSGSVVGAGKKWNEYKQAYPIFTGSGDKMEINNNRPAWQEYFASVGSGGATGVKTGVAGAAPVPTGEYTKSGKAVYIVNGVKGTID